jgi:ribokinase
MNIAVIVPFPGKKKYQAEYDAIVKAIEENGDTVLSPEKSLTYRRVLAQDAKLRETPKAHYEFIRKGIIDSDAVVVEASWEDFRVGHETTLALLYRKPVLALSQSLELGKYIHHPDFYGLKYTPEELANLVKDFLRKVGKDKLAGASPSAEKPGSKNNKTLAVFGGVYADIFNKVARIPRENEVELSSSFKISLGGKATNAAVALARMGNEVFICGRVGHDTMGNELEAALIHEGIKTDFLHQDPKADTGTVTLAVDIRAKFSTIVNEAANVHVTKKAVDALFREVDAGKLGLDCVYLTLEPQKEMVGYIIREAAKRNLFVFCDAAPYTRPLDAELLPLVDVVAPNQLEARAMTGIEVTNYKDAEEASAKLAKLGAKQTIITLGDHGAYFHGDNASQSVNALSVKAVDEAGAGDAFRAILVHELVQGQTMTAALKRATLAGAFAVTNFGSYDSMPTIDQLNDFAKNMKRAKIKVR